MMYRASEHAQESRTQMRGGEGTVRLTALTRELPGNLRLFSLLTVPEGASIGYHVHENETELFYFIEGRARVMDDERALEAAAGDVLSTPSGHGHSVQNIGEGELTLLACIVKD